MGEVAGKDAEAYAELQKTWRNDCSMFEDQKKQIEHTALVIPCKTIRRCYDSVKVLERFLPHCNPNIISDAKVGIHLLCGGARAAYATALVNKPNEEVKRELENMIKYMAQVERSLLP